MDEFKAVARHLSPQQRAEIRHHTAAWENPANAAAALRIWRGIRPVRAHPAALAGKSYFPLQRRSGMAHPEYRLSKVGQRLKTAIEEIGQ